MYEFIETLPYWLQVSLLLVPIMSLLVAAGAFVINVQQMYLNNRLRSAKIVADAISAFMNDDMMRQAFYRIEYNEFKYDGEKFHASSEEKEIDKG